MMIRKKDNFYQKSFSLLELSICILISGTLIAVSIISVDAVKQSRAQAIISQFETYRKAINSFYNDYGYLPGDLPNATFKLAKKEYAFYTEYQLYNLGKTNIEGTPITLLSNGKGYIFNCIGRLNGLNEFRLTDSLQTWVNLYAGGYIDEKYSGFCYTSTNTPSGCFKPYYNLPAVKYSDSYSGVWNFITLSRTNPTAGYLLGSFVYNGKYYNEAYKMSVLEIVSFEHTNSTYNEDSSNEYGCELTKNPTFYSTSRGGISNELLKIIDNKIDDGKPLTGGVLGHNSSKYNSYETEISPCIKTTAGQVVSAMMPFNPSSDTFKEINNYTKNNEAICVGVFLLPELKTFY